ncbi:MAG: TetR/AcrR family transcriptional regulator [Pseudomonadota bacterium]
MSGLREKQKADRQRRILLAAEEEFRRYGYEDTKIDAIAIAAGVSVGTVYNYFENKSDLLLELVTLHDRFVEAEIRDLINNPAKSLIDGVSGVFFAMTRHSLDHLGKENWRNLFGLSIAHRQTTLGDRFARFNDHLLKRIIHMLDVMQQNALLRKDCDTQRLGGILFRVETMHYIELASNDALSYEDYKKNLLKDLDFILTPFAQGPGWRQMTS